MKEKKLFTCEICNTDYNEKDKAVACEKNHKLLEKAVIIGEYQSIEVNKNGHPNKIKVKFPGSDKFITYKL